jgi:hypothetical protein
MLLSSSVIILTEVVLTTNQQLTTEFNSNERGCKCLVSYKLLSKRMSRVNIFVERTYSCVFVVYLQMPPVSQFNYASEDGVIIEQTINPLTPNDL